MPDVLKRVISDGPVSIRPTQAGDVPILVAGRDAEFERFLGGVAVDPQPAACIEVGARVVGWVDYDWERAWLEPGEVNLGYNVFAAERGHGFGTVAVKLLLRHLAEDTDWKVATLLIDSANERSLALARRAGFTRADDLDGHPYWKQPVRESTDGSQTESR